MPLSSGCFCTLAFSTRLLVILSASTLFEDVIFLDRFFEAPKETFELLVVVFNCYASHIYTLYADFVVVDDE